MARVLDSAQLDGVILVYQASQDSYLSNDFRLAETPRLPASTYKIPHSMIALETGVAVYDSVMFRWDGRPRLLKSWEADLTLRQAFLRSCVPCYQQVARAVGPTRMRAQLDKMGYPGMTFDSASIDRFWLVGESRISPREQVDFLRRFHAGELGLSPQTDSLMRRLMVLEKTDAYVLRGKTGWSMQGEKNNGWFVGYLSTADDLFFFATNIDPRPDFDMDHFGTMRREVTQAALDSLGVSFAQKSVD